MQIIRFFASFSFFFFFFFIFLFISSTCEFKLVNFLNLFIQVYKKQLQQQQHKRVQKYNNTYIWWIMKKNSGKQFSLKKSRKK